MAQKKKKAVKTTRKKATPAKRVTVADVKKEVDDLKEAGQLLSDGINNVYNELEDVVEAKTKLIIQELQDEIQELKNKVKPWYNRLYNWFVNLFRWN